METRSYDGAKYFVEELGSIEFGPAKFTTQWNDTIRAGYKAWEWVMSNIILAIFLAHICNVYVDQDAIRGAEWSSRTGSRADICTGSFELVLF